MIRLLLAKISIFSLFFFCLFFISWMEAYAAAGCCSHHGGVKGSCNTANNRLYCNDGTTSPTCLCSGSTSPKQPKSKKATSPNTIMTTTPAETTTTTTTSQTATSKNIKMKGCCSKHGGVKKCDKASGFKMCKDGTISTTCKC